MKKKQVKTFTQVLQIWIPPAAISKRKSQKIQVLLTKLKMDVTLMETSKEMLKQVRTFLVN